MTTSRAELSPGDLLVFAAVARERGVRGAARALGRAKSTVSRQLADLEAAVGGSLVTRTTRRFELTDVGRDLAETCGQLEDVMRASADIIERSRREPSGVLRVAASPLVGSEFLPDVLAELLVKYAALRIELHLTSAYVDLRRLGIDVAIRTGPIESASDLHAVRLGTSLTGHYASPDYLAAHGTPRSPEALRDHDCLVMGSTHRALWKFEGTQSVEVRGRLAVDNFAVARGAAVRGAGVLRTARFYTRALVKRGALVPILRGFWPRATLFAVHSAGRTPPPKVRAFIASLKAAMKPKLEP